VLGDFFPRLVEHFGGNVDPGDFVVPWIEGQGETRSDAHFEERLARLEVEHPDSDVPALAEYPFEEEVVDVSPTVINLDDGILALHAEFPYYGRAEILNATSSASTRMGEPPSENYIFFLVFPKETNSAHGHILANLYQASTSPSMFGILFPGG
jgi:hypothetical protein